MRRVVFAASSWGKARLSCARARLASRRNKYGAIQPNRRNKPRKGKTRASACPPRMSAYNTVFLVRCGHRHCRCDLSVRAVSMKIEGKVTDGRLSLSLESLAPARFS